MKRRPTRGIEGAVRAKAVARPGADAGDMRVEDIAGASRQANARGLAVRLVEERKEDRLGGAGGDGDIDAAVLKANAERLGAARSRRDEALAARALR